MESWLTSKAYIERERERLLRSGYAAHRQKAMDEGAAEDVGNDGSGFWSSVKDIAYGVGVYGPATAVDETVETGRKAIAESTPEAVGEGLERMDERFTEAAVGLQKKADRPAERQRIEAAQPEPPSLEVTAVRDAFGLEPPDTAGGQVGAGIGQFVTGAALAVGTGVPGMAARGASAVARPIVQKLAPKLAGSKAAQTTASWATGGQAAGFMSDYAAFDALDKRVLVAMNESPFLDRFIPDMLASHNPDDPEWKQRFDRAVEGGLLGGVVAGSAGLVWSGIRAYVHGVRAGRPGKVLDSPAKAAVEEAEEKAAIADQVRMEQEIHAIDLWSVSPERAQAMREAELRSPEAAQDLADVAAREAPDPDTFGDALMGKEVAGEITEDEAVKLYEKYAALYDTDPGKAMDLFEEHIGPVGRATDEAPEAAPAAAEAPPDTALRLIGEPAATNSVSLADQLASRANMAKRRQARAKPEPAEGEAPVPGGIPDLHDTADHAAALWGATTDTGLRDVATPGLALAERQAIDRMREASAAGGVDDVRNAAAEKAVMAWRRRFSAEWGRAKGQEDFAPPDGTEAAWTGAETGREWLALQKTAMRDVGRLNPDLDDASVPASVATLRSEPVSKAQARLPEGFVVSDLAADKALYRQRPEVMRSVVLPPAARGVLRQPTAVAEDLPVDVHFDAIHTPDDLVELVATVGRSRPEDVNLELGPAMHLNAQGMVARDLEIDRVKALEEAQWAEIKRGTGSRGVRTLRREKAAETRKKREALEKAQAEAKSAQKRMRAEQDALEKASGNARAEVVEILEATGYRPMVPGLRDSMRPDLDPRLALHVIEAVGGSLNRIAMSASSDLVSASQRAAAVRALHKAEAVMRWIQGDDKAAAEALRRGALPVEEGALAFRPPGAKDVALDTEVARRWRSKQLVAQSGGTRAVQARMAGMANAEDVGEVLHHLAGWRRQSEYAWGLGRRLGVHNYLRTAMQTRMGALLSRPGTWTMNLTSNALFAPIHVEERFLTELYQGRPMAGAREASDMVQGWLPGAVDGLRMLKIDGEIMLRGQAANASVRDKVKRDNLLLMYDEFKKREFDEGYARVSTVGLPEVLKDAAAGNTLLEPLANVADRALDVGITHGIYIQQLGDIWFKNLSYHGELNRLAKRQVRNELGARTAANAAEWDKRVARLRDHPPPEMFEQAADLAHVATFTGESSALVEGYINAMRRYPALRAVTPFVRTPSNVFFESLHRTPLIGLMTNKNRAAMRSGPEGRAQVAARQTTGAIAASIAYAMLQNDLITGSEPRNEQQRNHWRSIGKKPFSIKARDGTWNDYRQVLGPYALPMVVAVDLMEMAAAAETDDEFDALAEAAGVARNIWGFSADAFFLGDLLDLTDETSGPKLAGAGRRWVEGAMPLSSALRSAGRNFRDEGYIQDFRATGGMGGADEPTSEMLLEEWQTFTNVMKDRYFWWLGANKHYRYTPHGKVLSYQAGNRILGMGDLVRGYAGFAAYSYEDPDPLAMAEHRYEAVPRFMPRTYAIRHRGFSRTIEYTQEEYEYLSARAGQLYYQAAHAHMKTAQWGKEVDVERQNALLGLQRAAEQKARRETLVKFPDLRRRQDALTDVMAVEYETQIARRRAERAQAAAGGG